MKVVVDHQVPVVLVQLLLPIEVRVSTAILWQGGCASSCQPELRDLAANATHLVTIQLIAVSLPILRRQMLVHGASFAALVFIQGGGFWLRCSVLLRVLGIEFALGVPELLGEFLLAVVLDALCGFQYCCSPGLQECKGCFVTAFHHLSKASD